jgi:hypothetical protein
MLQDSKENSAYLYEDYINIYQRVQILSKQWLKMDFKGATNIRLLNL